jgi:hypothetical protein
MPASMLRSRISNEYSVRPISEVVSDSPVNGSNKINSASEEW